VKRESMMILKWAAGIKASYEVVTPDADDPSIMHVKTLYRIDVCDSERFLRFSRVQTRHATDVDHMKESSRDVEVFLDNTKGIKRSRRSLASVYINQYWR
jgi:hypothetical protein